MAGFNGLTFAVQPVVTAAGALNTAGLIAGTTLIAGILDPVSTQRVFNPVIEGNPVATGDAASKWLPVVDALTATEVFDNYWLSVPGQTAAASPKVGQVQLQLTPAAANTVEASSVMKYYLSPGALVITATGTF